MHPANPARLLWLILSVAVLAADQASKAAILHAFEPGTGAIITSFFNLVLVQNHGISFGLFNHGLLAGETLGVPNAALAISLVALLIVLVLLRWLVRAETCLTAAALALVIGGALGNVVDRFRYGSVVDFLDFHWQAAHYPAFNVADCAVVSGVALLLLASLVFANKPPQDAAP